MYVMLVAAGSVMGDARTVLAHRIGNALGVGSLMLVMAFVLVISLIVRPRPGDAPA